MIVGEGATVVRSHGTGAIIGAGASVGPFSYLRPGTNLGRDGKIGAFVETKNAQIGARLEGSAPRPTSAMRRSARTSNIGAATIFVNYDGVTKHHTTVGDHVRIGSDNTLDRSGHGGGRGLHGCGGDHSARTSPPGALANELGPAADGRGLGGAPEARHPSAKAARAAREVDVKPEALAPGAQNERAAAKRSEAKGEA